VSPELELESGSEETSSWRRVIASLVPLLREYLSYAVLLRMGYIILCSFLYVLLFESLKKRVLRSRGCFSWLANFCCSGAACLLTVLLTQAVDSNIYRYCRAVVGADWILRRGEFTVVVMTVLYTCVHTYLM
jgi:hypothetical protein